MRSRFDSKQNLLSISSTVCEANWSIYFVWWQWLCQKGKFDLWVVCQIIMKKFIILNDGSHFMRNHVESSSLFRIKNCLSMWNTLMFYFTWVVMRRSTKSYRPLYLIKKNLCYVINKHFYIPNFSSCCYNRSRIGRLSSL